MLITRKLIRRRRNPLVFPTGIAPGIDQNHPAAKNLRFSGVSMFGAGGFANLLTGFAGVLGGTVSTSPIDGLVGPGLKTGGNSSTCTFAGQSTANDNTVTMAAILYYRQSTAVENYIFNTSSTTNGAGIEFNNSNPALFRINFWGGTGISSGYQMKDAHPYFLAASCNASISAFAVAQLDTGQITLATSTGAATTLAPNGTFNIGQAPPGGAACPSTIAAVMFGAAFTPVQTLAQWAQDPWAFWYPQDNTSDLMVGVAAAAATFTPWITRAPTTLGW